MAHTYARIYLHVIFSTKRREPSLTSDIRARLFSYIGSVVRNLDAELLRAGGVDDHIHLLLSLTPSHAPADLIRDIKSYTSRWIHDTFPKAHDFAWQPGYSAFSVSYSGLNDVIAYIDNQESHHRAQSFEDEYLTFLRRHNVEFDPRWTLDQ